MFLPVEVPVILSSKNEPSTYSMFRSVSVSPQPSVAVPVDRRDAYALRHSGAASIPLLKDMLADPDRSAPTR